MRRLLGMNYGILQAAVFAAVIATGAVATTSLYAEDGGGCCGVAESAEICILDDAFVECTPGQGGNAQCNGANSNFPHCCEADGFCDGPVID